MQKPVTTKPEVRKTARLKRQRLCRELDNVGVAIAQHFVDTYGAMSINCVAGYWPHGSEADCRPILELLERRGGTCALPVVVAKDRPLVFRQWHDGDLVALNKFGIPEPVESAQQVSPDAVLVPLLAFDAKGRRLGRGGGFYDRTLKKLRAEGDIMVIGIGFAGQQVAELVSEPHDERLDAVVTETGAITFRHNLRI